MYTVKYCYSKVQHNMVFHIWYNNDRLNVHLRLYSQKTLHISPLRAICGLSFVRIWVKIDCVITALYCILILFGEKLVITSWLYLSTGANGQHRPEAVHHWQSGPHSPRHLRATKHVRAFDRAASVSRRRQHPDHSVSRHHDYLQVCMAAVRTGNRDAWVQKDRSSSQYKDYLSMVQWNLYKATI